MTYPRAVTASLLETDGTTVGAVTFGDAFGIDFYDELNGVGRGQLSLPLSSTDAAEVTPGRYIDIQVAGTSRFTFKIEGNPTYDQVQVGEEIDQILTVQGRGWGVCLDEAVTYPEVELNARLDSPWRLFSFASPSFPNAGAWGAAVELYEYLDAISAGRGRYQVSTVDGFPYPSPISFPVPTSPIINDNSWTPGDANPTVPGANYVPVYWIWTEANYPNEEYELGWCFLRGEFTLADDAVVTISATGDNYFTVFLEGVPIFGENVDVYIWQGWKETPIPLVAGTYTIAAVVENVGFPGQTGTLTVNPGGFICTVHEVDSNNLPNTVHLVSDDSWVCDFVGNEDKWPGWTPGQIVGQLLTEATARGCITVLDSVTYAATTDSDSNAWLPVDTDVNYAYAASFAVEVGTTLRDALDSLHEAGWVNWHVQPGTFILDVWRGRLPSSPSSSATLAAGTNLVSLERAETAVYANALLVQWEEGFVVIDDASEGTTNETSYGTRVEALYSSDATSADDASQAGRTELLRRAQEGFPAIVVTVEPASTADCPYEGFTIGDYVTIPAVGGGTEVVRVLSIACNQDDEGYAVWTLELNERLQVPEAQDQELLRQLGGRLQVERGTVT